MKRKTSVAFSDGLLDNAKKIAEALDRSVSYVLEEAVILGLPSVMASEKRKNYTQLMELGEAIIFQASKLNADSVAEKPIPQSDAAAGSAGGGVARAVDPRTSETPGTSQAPRRRRSSG